MSAPTPLDLPSGLYILSLKLADDLKYLHTVSSGPTDTGFLDYFDLSPELTQAQTFYYDSISKTFAASRDDGFVHYLSYDIWHQFGPDNLHVAFLFSSSTGPTQWTIMSNGNMFADDDATKTITAIFGSNNLVVNLTTDAQNALGSLPITPVPIGDVSPTESMTLTLQVHVTANMSDSPQIIKPQFDGNLMLSKSTQGNAKWYFDAVSRKLGLIQNGIPGDNDQVWFGVPVDAFLRANPVSWNNSKADATPVHFSATGLLYAMSGSVTAPIIQLNGLLSYTSNDDAFNKIPPNSMALFKWTPYELLPLVDLLRTALTEIPPSDPNFRACYKDSKNVSDTSQICFYNHAPDTPNVATFPNISRNPNIVLGYNRAALLGKPMLGSNAGGNPVVRLGQPNDALQLNNKQASICFNDSQCNCQGQSPDFCKTGTDGYCWCGALDNPPKDPYICGLSCADGLEAFALKDCHYILKRDVYVSGYQCFPARIYGITDAKTGAKTCVKYAGPDASAPSRQVYTSMQACTEQWADCPPGYTRTLVGDHPGCHRVKEFGLVPRCDPNCSAPYASCGPPCDPSDSGCRADNDCAETDAQNNCKRFNTYSWNGTCSGNCARLDCKCYCADWRTVPPWGYYCVSNNGKPYWQQNVSDNPIRIDPNISKFRSDDQGQDAYCVMGTGKYA